MRGNHRLIGRNDYTPPPALTEAQCQWIASVEVEPTFGRKTWFTVTRGGELLGYVTTRIYGQEFRTPDLEGWLFACSDWNQSDPPHGRAIIRLLDLIDLPSDGSPAPGTNP